MEEAAVAEKLDKRAAPFQSRAVVAFAVAIIAVVWFMSLSAWLDVKPGALITQRHNVLFDSDMSKWLGRMIGNEVSMEQAVHPLELVLWRYPNRAVAHAARLFMPTDAANVFGPRLLTSLFAGAGVGFLAYLALFFGVAPVQILLLFGSYLLFTSSITICLPEHFGISAGLLTIGFVVFVVVANERVKNTIQALLIVLCGGTSILNAFFPAYCLFESVVKNSRLKLRLMLTSVPVGLAACLLLYRISGTIHRFFGSLANFRIPYHPVQAIFYSFQMLVAPAIGGKPFLKNPAVFDFSQGWLMVSYDPVPTPLGLSQYYGLQAIGAVAWIVLLVRCVHVGLRDVETRPYVKVALMWILFSLVFYNVWGREPFLYSSAWAWTLMALVFLGARHLSRAFTAAAVLPLAACQLVTLYEVKSLLVSITH